MQVNANSNYWFSRCKRAFRRRFEALNCLLKLSAPTETEQHQEMLFTEKFLINIKLKNMNEMKFIIINMINVVFVIFIFCRNEHAKNVKNMFAIYYELCSYGNLSFTWFAWEKSGAFLRNFSSFSLEQFSIFQVSNHSFGICGLQQTKHIESHITNSCKWGQRMRVDFKGCCFP